MIFKDRTLTINDERFWYECLPGWALPEAFSVMPSVLSSIESLNSKKPKRVNFSDDVSFMCNWLRINLMPRKKKETNNDRSNGRKNVATAPKWVNISLTDDDIATIGERALSAQKAAAELLALCLDGYSVGCKPSPDGQGWMCYIMGQASDDENVIVGLSGYADAPFDAINSALYKFHTKLGGCFTTPADRVKSQFR